MQRLHLRVLRLLILATVGTVLLIDRPAQGYHDTTTHPDLAKRSIGLAIKTDPRYQELDWYRKEIIEGDEAEDVGCRSTNHFFDPQTGLGLPTNWYTQFWMDRVQGFLNRQSFCGPPKGSTRYRNALDWARDGMPKGDGKLDWQGAIEAYDYSGKLRAYEALGHVLHLLQDLGQPDHARNRPHPCNTITLPPSYVGSYEALWQTLSSPPSSSPSSPPLAQWMKGSTPQRFKTLDEAFIGLAKKSQSTEDSADRFDGSGQKGLPFPDELALGCRTSVVINSVNDQFVAAEFAKSPSTFMKKAEDSLWLKYELNLPAIRTIPPNANDYRYRAYLALGKTLLPIVEEYGAGLLMFFYDIVNPPPYVEEVEIYQNGQRKYRKAWKDEISGNPPRVTRRNPEKDDGKLEAGVDAELIIRIGPKDEDIDHKGTFIRRGLKSLKVTVVPEGEKPEQGTLVAVTSGGDEKSPKGGVWKGHFTPSRSATLRIEGFDVNEHFKDEGGQREQSLTPVEGKSGTQGELDADPSTPARATWRESKSAGEPAGPPYPWTGYEAGPDLNHKFTVSEVACGPLGSKQMEAMRWGTWTGTIVDRQTLPTPPGGQYEAARFSVSFRTAFDSAQIKGRDHIGTAFSGGTGGTHNAYDLTSSFPDFLQSALSLPPLIRLGRMRSSGTWAWPGQDPITHTGYWRPGQRDSAFETHGDGYLDFAGFYKERSWPQFRFYLIAFPKRSISRSAWKTGAEGGEVCADGKWAGKTKGPNGEVSWDFQFRPSEPPPHVTKHVSVAKLHIQRIQGGAVFNKLVEAELSVQMPAAYRHGGKNAYQRIEDASVEVGKACSILYITSSESAGNRYNETLVRVMQLWLPYISRPEEELVGKDSLREQLSDTELDAALDQAYARELSQLDTAIAQWQQENRTRDARCAAATEALATVIQTVNNTPSPVLREIAQKIREKGIESLAGAWGNSPKPGWSGGRN